MLNRRDLLRFTSLCATFASLKLPLTAVGDTAQIDDTNRFTYEKLITLAEKMAMKPYVRPATPAQSSLSKIDYNARGLIRFDTTRALFAKGPGKYPLTFFHLGDLFRVPVKMHVIANGISQPIDYDKTLFSMPADSPAQALGADSGFAGFRFQESRLGNQKKLDWKQNDWVAFLGPRIFEPLANSISMEFQPGV